MGESSPCLTISAQQRDALYAQLLDHLGGIDDLRIAFERRDFQSAYRLGRQFADALRLILDDLGWGDHRDGSIELRSPSKVLRRVLAHQRSRAIEQLEAEGPELDELREMTDRASLVRDTCEQLLDRLGDGSRDLGDRDPEPEAPTGIEPV